MKTIGIIGGLGPEATVEYYKRIIDSFKNINPAGSLNYPEIIIYSVNMGLLMGHMQKKEYDLAVRYLTYSIQKLKEAGVDFAAITANTPHQFFDEIQAKNCLPLLSIVEATRDKAEQMGLSKVGLIGTRFTMEASFYKDVFSKSKIEVFVPNTQEIEFINHKLFTELEIGIFKDETREELLQVISKLIERHNINALILGCTEFPLLFDEESYLDIHFMDTLQIHVDKIVETCLASE